MVLYIVLCFNSYSAFGTQRLHLQVFKRKFVCVVLLTVAFLREELSVLFLL